jgi:protein O-mannosyl-transferase
MGWRALMACAGAALLSGAVYLNALHNPFVYDDFHTVVENASILNLANLRAIVLGAVTRPIVNFSYAVDRQVWGSAPFGFHLTNVLLHVTNVVLLFQIAWRFEKDRQGSGGAESSTAACPAVVAFAAAALFAVHPMMTEAVGYISGRSEVLCTTFLLLALMCGRQWLSGRSEHRRYTLGAMWPVLTVGFWLAALASKETAAIFPLVFLVYDRFGVGRTVQERRRRFLTVHLPLIGTAILGGAVRLAVLARVEYPGQVSIHWNYVLLELDVVGRYAWMMINPSGQAIFHEVGLVGLLDRQAWIDIAVVGSLAAIAWKVRRADWVAGFGLLWFLLALVPSSALIALDQGELMAEHRVYLASCGFFLTAGAAIGWLGAWLHARHVRYGRLLAGSAFGLVLLSLATETVLRNAVWSDPVALWRESVDLAPNHYRPRLLLGEALQDAGRRNEAIEQYKTAIRLRPGEPMGYVKVGQCLAEIGQWPQARQQFLQALAIDPRNAAAHHSLTVLKQMESRFGIDDSRR